MSSLHRMALNRGPSAPRCPGCCSREAWSRAQTAALSSPGGGRLRRWTGVRERRAALRSRAVGTLLGACRGAGRGASALGFRGLSRRSGLDREPTRVGGRSATALYVSPAGRSVGGRRGEVISKGNAFSHGVLDRAPEDSDERATS